MDFEIPGYTPSRRRAKAPVFVVPERKDAAWGITGVPSGGRVQGEDDRRPVQSETRPWSHVCALEITAATGETFLGTGWLVGRKTVITAGHCVYMHAERGAVRSIKVTPGLDGARAPFGSKMAVAFGAMPGWMRQDPASDVAGIVIEGPGFRGAGSFGFGVAAREKLLSAVANIAGYPEDLGAGHYQYFHGRVPKAVDLVKRAIVYDTDTYGGQSGSPIWINTGGVRAVIGVHTTGGASVNSGVLIDSEVFRYILDWKKKGDSA